jgi:hypothetical protein
LRRLRLINVNLRRVAPGARTRAYEYAYDLPKTGCQLAASLLSLELGRRGLSAEYVCGHYSANPEQEHWWVEVESVLLDPSRDQFDGEDPFSEDCDGQYSRASSKPVSEMQHEATTHLQLHWSFNHRVRPEIKDVVAFYALDLAEVERPMGLLSTT